MQLRLSFALFALVLLPLSGCNDKFATSGYGDVNGYGTKEVGLCTYLGGCMPDSSDGE